MQYVQFYFFIFQGLLVFVVVRGLQLVYGYGMYLVWVSLVTYFLSYFGKFLGWIVTFFIVQICKNLDELIKQYESEFVKFFIRYVDFLMYYYGFNDGFYCFNDSFYNEELIGCRSFLEDNVSLIRSFFIVRRRNKELNVQIFYF